MPLLSVEAKNAALDNDYAARDCELALFAGDPMVDGVELDALDCPGYARASVPAGAWNNAADGTKTSDVVQFADATDEWTTTATHWQLYDAVTGDGWDNGPLSDPLDVTAAGAGPAVQVVVFYDDDVDPEF